MRSGWKLESKRSPRGQPRQYQSQYDNAKYHAIYIRNIEWQFTYDTWVAWWGDDMALRGPYSGQLVMARYNDAGPYHPDNVYKSTCNDNCRDGQRNRKNLKRLKVVECNS